MLKILDWQDPNYAYQILRTKHLTSTEVQCYSPNQRSAAEEMGVAPWEFFFFAYLVPEANLQLPVLGSVLVTVATPPKSQVPPTGPFFW
jgi:hypothetical protein